jgi:hypothetical protein
VSVEAISWALNLAPVPAGRGGQPSSACKFVLAGLANRAGPDGTGAFPSVGMLVRYTGLSERTVRTCLDRLEAGGIIAPCDPGIVAARIKRADRRPQGWDLNLRLARHDLNDAAVGILERQCPGLGVRLAAAGQPGADGQSDGVQPPHPVATGGPPPGRLGRWPADFPPIGQSCDPLVARSGFLARVPLSNSGAAGQLDAGAHHQCHHPAQRSWRVTASGADTWRGSGVC